MRAIVLSSLAMVATSVVMIHEPPKVPPGWEPSSEWVYLDERMEVLVGVQRPSPERLDKIFWEASTPGRTGYLEHYSWEAMGEVVRPSERALGAVVAFLVSHGATQIRVAAHGDYISASLTLRELESATSGKFATFLHAPTGRQLVRLTGGVRVPDALAEHVETFTGLFGFPLDARPSVSENSTAGSSGVTPRVINTAYSIGTVTKSGKNNTQSVAQFQGQYVSPTDLSKFCSRYNPEGVNCSIAKFVGKNSPGQPGVESMLDVEYIMGVGQGISTWVYSYPNFDFCGDLLKWANDVASLPKHPNVVSMSYGSQKIDFCDKATIARLSQDVQKLGAMGITVVIASGDDGSGGNTRQGSNNGKLSPSFPASIPYVLAVGSTYFEHGLSGPEQATTQFGSGGGFSYDYDMPDYQSSAVKGYLEKSPKTGTKAFAKSGRGSPDVALLGEQFQVLIQGSVEGVGGTSASTPTWGAIIALLNEECLVASNGAKTLGFVNPLLYLNPDAFTDITVGTSAIADNAASGWKCTKGWDAVTGLGTPAFDKLQTVVRKACGGSDKAIVV